MKRIIPNLVGMLPSKTKVLIVGAGPTGLMLANHLQKFKVDFVIIDTKDGPTLESRALAVSARSMELYQQLELSDEILQNSLKVQQFDIYSNGKMKGSISTRDIGSGLSEFPNMMTIFEQNKNEKILYKNLKTFGGKVLWNTSFSNLQQHDERVEARVEIDGQEHLIAAEFLVGCDGASSPVRHQLNLTFEGGTYENKFFVADVIVKKGLSPDTLTLAPADKLFSAFFPMEGTDAFRLVGTLPREFAERDDIDFEDIKAAVKESSNMNLHYDKVNWFSTYKLHHRCVNKFSEGRVFLSGDAAHIHSPAGGQGMNTGLHDAHNLAWKLAMVVKHKANRSLLDTYEEERMPFAKWVLSFTDRGFSFLSSTNYFATLFRKYILLNLIPRVMNFKFVKRKAFITISQIWYAYHRSSLTSNLSSQNLKFTAGDRFPFIRSGFCAEFSKSAFYLIHVSESGNDKYSNDLDLLNGLEVFYKHEELDSSWNELGVKEELFVLVRPDMFIGMLSDKMNQEILKSYFIKFVSNV